MRQPGAISIGDIRVKYYITSNAMETSSKKIEVCGVDNDDGKLQISQRLSTESKKMNFEKFVSRYVR